MTVKLDGAVLLPIDMQRAFDGAPWPRRRNRLVDQNARYRTEKSCPAGIGLPWAHPRMARRQRVTGRWIDERHERTSIKK